MSRGWVDRYRAPAVMTRLRPDQEALIHAPPGDVPSLCATARDLLITPDLAAAAGFPPERLDERNVRPAEAIVDLALAHHGALDAARSVQQRVVGTCRDFAVVSCALLIARGIPARARCGFATYFVPGRAVDHWITEHWSHTEQRWIRIDAEIAGLDLGLVARADDLSPEDFLTGGEAWTRHRSGAIDAGTFGVHGTENWGWPEIAGNVIRDLAALDQQEMLPWDEWGPMTPCYAWELTPAIESLLDACATACNEEDHAALTRLWAEVPVPVDLLR